MRTISQQDADKLKKSGKWPRDLSGKPVVFKKPDNASKKPKNDVVDKLISEVAMLSHRNNDALEMVTQAFHEILSNIKKSKTPVQDKPQYRFDYEIERDNNSLAKRVTGYIEKM